MHQRGPEAKAVFLSGTGMPTLAMLQVLEDDLGKPVISAASAMMGMRCAPPA
jgi:maleate isomerase